jgi:hypothetical protein
VSEILCHAAEPARKEAREFFPNMGLHRNAEFLASLSPGAIDYLRQAPVLALACGAKGNTRADRLYVAMRIGGPIQRGERLRTVMAAVGIPYPLRKLSASILSPSARGAVYALKNVNPSTIAQIIPTKSGDQRKWFMGFNAFVRRFDRRNWISPTNVMLEWAAQQIAQALPHHGEAGDVADYLIDNRSAQFQDWSWPRAMLEVTRWHDRIALEKRLPPGIEPETCIDYSDWPEHAEIAGFEFFKLATPSALMEEGRRMRHCVASYVPDVMNGSSSVFSVRHEMRRVATLQVAKGKVVQLKGFANKLPSKPVAVAAQQFVGIT